jgi:S-(hydroxymethyl)glutathione dehydrogenase/alcohol dehydrogenase
MKAIVAYEPLSKLVLEEVDLMAPVGREVRVRLMASGVCHSDWHILKGEWGTQIFPVILGHEGAGIVEGVGEDVRNVKVGDHVVLAWRTSCGLCEPCQKGFPALCDRSPTVRQRPVLHGTDTTLSGAAGLGTFATEALCHENGVVKIDDDIPFAQAALVGCGVATGVGAVINTAQVWPGATVAVWGCGGVGLNCIQGAVVAGASQIIAVDMLDNKLEMGKKFGATDTVNAAREDVVERIKELTGGFGVHFAFEAIGLVEAPFVQSILATRKRGVTCWVGHAPLNTPVTIDARALMQEKTVIASMYGSSRPHVDFPRLLKLYQNGQLKLDELVTRRFPLEEAQTAFDVLSRGEVARSVLEIAN